MLELPIEKALGVSQSRLALLKKLKIQTIEDLIYYYPRGYEDRSQLREIASLKNGETALIKGTVAEEPALSRIRKNLCMIKVKVFDDSGMMQITFFNQKFVVSSLKKGETYLFYGKAKVDYRSISMSSPVFEPENSNRHMGHIIPLYSLTKGLSQKVFTNIMAGVIGTVDEDLEETLPTYLKERLHLCDRVFAFHNIHFPRSFEALEAAKQRLVFEELLFLQLGQLSMNRLSQASHGIRLTNFKIVEKLNEMLPFELTNAQKRVIREICADFRDGKQLNRLIQGDVGSGKTIVACAIMLVAANNGYQSALMAPTEILAVQHYDGLKGYFEAFGFVSDILTGSTPKKRKKEILERLKNNEIQILFGTHAILEDDVEFAKFALCITDEQHRFGVKQRNSLYSKGENPHTLVMTATPIPRTLALIMYSDLDVSVIDELPPNRQKVETYCVSEGSRTRIDAFLSRELKDGSQAYIVCPLVEEWETMTEQLKNVTDYTRQLKEKFPDFRMELLHGKMKSKDKDEIMMRFKNHEVDVLVSTTVIEVGVNVPNATLMIVENAERFGLAQLHQLRGRVGRGKKKSYCILVSSATARNTRERMKVLCQTNDGFQISEQDLRQRGPGDFFGTDQSGFVDLKIANLIGDVKVLELASRTAKKILAEDPELSDRKNYLLKKSVKKLFLKNGVKVFN